MEAGVIVVLVITAVALLVFAGAFKKSSALSREEEMRDENT